MSHFAELDENDKVIRVLVMPEEASTKANLDWLEGVLGGRWIQTSITKKYRARFALPGMVHDRGRDAFYFPKPDDGNPDWFFNEETVRWELPKGAGAK